MFPTARNSLRRWSEHYHNKIPIPIAVTLHNFLLNDQVVSHAQTQYGRIEHNSNLLPPITLEIIVSENNVVFSETTQNVHPSWEHLDERIGLPGEWWLKDDSGIYKTMKLRFYLPNHKLLLEIPIYPASLQKLDSDETPEALPPNSCFIYFSDGSTRLPESIFQILLDQKLTTLPPIEDFSRFEDDVFRTLDTVAQTPERKRRSDSLLDGEQEPKTLFPKTTTPTTTQTVIPFDHSEQDILQGDFKQEAASLEALIAQEEQALQDELEALNEQKTSLGNLVQNAKYMEDQNLLLQKEIASHTSKVQKEQFSREAQRINLFRDLQTIYPISIDPQKGFLIRDLRLPVDIKTTTVTDEELSAALGFACHLIFIMSKYLSVGLRHKLFCNSSRSAVQEDGSATVYPLFAVRGVEREKLDNGLALLGENVDCMLLTFEIDFTLQSHILQRLNHIYEHVTQSKQASSGMSN